MTRKLIIGFELPRYIVNRTGPNTISIQKRIHVRSKLFYVLRVYVVPCIKRVSLIHSIPFYLRNHILLVYYVMFFDHMLYELVKTIKRIVNINFYIRCHSNFASNKM